MVFLEWSIPFISNGVVFLPGDRNTVIQKTGINTAFKALVIPILEYACPVWNPYLVKHTKAIEAIQGRASRLICGPDKEYPDRLLALKWDPLELRRKYLSLVQMYKIIFGYCDINCHHTNF